MGSTFRLIFQTLASLAIAFNIILGLVSVPFIMDNYEHPSIRFEQYVALHLFLSCIFVSYIFYEGYRRRQIFYFTSTISIIGIALILLGSAIQMPYHEYTWIRKDISSNITPWEACHDNGSSRQISIPPNSSQQYFIGAELKENESIIQIEIDTTGPTIFTMGWISFSSNYEIVATIFNKTLHEGWFEDGNDFDWIPFFWTPERDVKVNWIKYIFKNPNDREIIISFRVTEFFLKTTEQVRTVYYDTLLDQSYAYGGLMLISISIVLTTLWWPIERKSNPNPTNSRMNHSCVINAVKSFIKQYSG